MNNTAKWVLLSLACIVAIVLFYYSLFAFRLLVRYLKTERILVKEMPVTLSFDWDFEKTETGQFPAIDVTGQLFSSSFTAPDLSLNYGGLRLLKKKLNGKEYFGIYVKGNSKSSGNFERSLFEFYLRPVKAQGKSVDIYMMTKVKCEVEIKNFLGGSLKCEEGMTEIPGPPYIFDPGQYHLWATRQQINLSEKK